MRLDQNTRQRTSTRFTTICTVCLSALCWLIAGPSLRASEPVDYITQIKPLLETKCYACHGVLKQEAGLRLETRELMQLGGDSGPVLQAQKPDASLLLERITDDEDLRMPPADEGAALKADEIDLIRRWIEQGAHAPHEDPPLPPRAHWAFQRIEKPTLPPLSTSNSTHPIDLLLDQKRAQLGLQTQPPADRSLLIRRLYLDLIGLPPTRQQLHDDRPWEQIVDELLASPQHGERWGRHWMDVWRYSDWYGLGKQLRYSQKHIWRWRDWIVNSLNDDLGYDQMIQQMLAGDELAPNDPQVIAATGFLARNYYLFNRTTWLDSTIEHTGKAFLGLTLNCAKCHDHKYDPISQVDYYNFRAIFEPHQVRLDPVPGVLDFERDGLPRVFDQATFQPTQLHIKGDPKNPDDSITITPRVPELLADFQPPITPVNLPVPAYAPAVRKHVQADHLNAATARLKQAQQQLTNAKKQQVKSLEHSPEKPKTSSSQPDTFEFVDHFDRLDEKHWKITGPAWQYVDGTVRRTTSTRQPEQLLFLQPVPADFEVNCRYTVIGGETYKSVIIRFDQSEDLSYSNFIYSSAHEPGPKIQAAYTRGGGTSYPADGRKAQPLEVGRTYELRFAVRGQLINVWLDGDFVLAYEYPDRQPGGALSLAGFDAAVAFDKITIRTLPADTQLIPSGKQPAATTDPQTQLNLATARVNAAQAELESLQATFAADSARYTQTDTELQKTTALQAAQTQATHAVAVAKYELLQAGDDDKKQAAAQKQLNQAEAKLAAVDQQSPQYESVRASLKALETPAHKPTDYPPTYAATSTGRRTALAQWVTSPDNPLTARVAVNHVWLRHFGEPLVESVADFGLRTKRPLQADLLDYLAAEFIEHNWSFKHLHRLIVTSAAYQLSSSTQNADAATLTQDSTNQYYWRMNTRRMESQAVRDCLLQLAGQLELTIGGPSVDVGPTSRRRSLYFKHSRDQQDKFLTMFDDADLLQCYRREQSIVPQQALALANSQLALTIADQIAARLTAQQPDDNLESFIDAAFETILARPANAAERQACFEYCQQLKQLNSSDSAQQTKQRIRARLVHSLLNHNDFISIR